MREIAIVLMLVGCTSTTRHVGSEATASTGSTSSEATAAGGAVGSTEASATISTTGTTEAASSTGGSVSSATATETVTTATATVSTSSTGGSTGGSQSSTGGSTGTETISSATTGTATTLDAVLVAPGVAQTFLTNEPINFEVVACVNAPGADIAIDLFIDDPAEHVNESESPVTSSGIADPICPTGYPYAARKLRGLQDSPEAAGDFVSPSYIRALTVDGGELDTVSIWVDTSAPIPEIRNSLGFDPPPYCNTTVNSSSYLVSSVRAYLPGGMAEELELTVTRGGTVVHSESLPVDAASNESGEFQFSGFTFEAGVNELVVTAWKATGNGGVSAPCVLTLAP